MGAFERKIADLTKRRVLLIQIIYGGLQAVVAEFENRGPLQAVVGCGEVVRTGPDSHQQGGRIVFILGLLDLVAHLFPAAVENFFFVKINVKNISIFYHNIKSFFIKSAGENSCRLILTETSFLMQGRQKREVFWKPSGKYKVCHEKQEKNQILFSCKGKLHEIKTKKIL